MIIAFEGCDQAGKRTQSMLLRSCIRGATLFDFPDYSSGTGQMLRRFLDDGHDDFAGFHAMMAANMSESGAAIRKASKSGVCVMNRYVHSNVVYGMARGLDRAHLESLVELPPPDAVVLLDADWTASGRRTRQDTMEKNGALQAKVRKLYLQEARADGWIVVPATWDINGIHRAVKRRLKRGFENIPFI